jgi:hypothetical protein
MKFKELETTLDYKNSSIFMPEITSQLLPENLLESAIKTTDNFYPVEIKIKDREHFTELLSHISGDRTIILEDADQKYIISGDFACKV